MRNRFYLTLAMILGALQASAQDGMEEFFYQSGKIKVVIGVAFIVLTGLIIYLWRLDRRVSHMENQQKERKS